MSNEQQPAAAAAEQTQFKLLRFNPRRYQRGAEAAFVECAGSEFRELLWMSKADIRNNIRDHGEHPELMRALRCYGDPTVEIREESNEQ